MILLNLIRFQALSGGTLDFGVGAADAGCVVPEAAYVTDGKVYTYVARSADGKQFEYGAGAYSLSTHVLARTTIYSTSNNNNTSKVDFALPPFVDVHPSPKPVLETVPPVPRAFDNLIINGSHECSQEIGATQTTLANSTVKYATDQWVAGYNHAANTAVVKFQQVAPPGSPAIAKAFPKCLQVTATTALSSIGSSDYGILAQYIEGNRASALGFGSAAAQPVTIGFWVYATIPGNMTVSLINNAGDRSWATLVAVNAGNTWEYKTILIPAGDVTGTWLKDTGIGVDVRFALAAGSSFLSGSANTWQGGNTFGLVGQTNFLASNNNTVCITGVGLWAGTYLTTAANSSLTKRGLEEELVRVRRYWQLVTLSLEHGAFDALARAQFTMTLDTPMRVTPTRTRLSTPVQVNIRNSDPATFVITSAINATQLLFSAEAQAAGECQAQTIESLNARM